MNTKFTYSPVAECRIFESFYAGNHSTANCNARTVIHKEHEDAERAETALLVETLVQLSPEDIRKTAIELRTALRLTHANIDKAISAWKDRA
jgi:hypothetical protein